MKPSKRARKRPLKLKDEDNSRNCGPIYDSCPMIPSKRAKKRPLALKDEVSDTIYESCAMIPSKRTKKRSLKVKDEESDIWYELTEMEDLLQKLSLTRVILKDYVVCMRSEFDLNLAGEPYIAAMLLLDRVSGRFFARIWNRNDIYPARKIDSNVLFILF